MESGCVSRARCKDYKYQRKGTGDEIKKKHN